MTMTTTNRTVVYGANTLTIEDTTLTVADIQASMAEIFPEIKSAEAVVNGSTITFQVKAGTKGMANRTVVYGANTLTIEDSSLSVADIQASMAEIFPEIKSAQAVVEGSTIKFEVKAGTKGMRTVVYGANTLNIEDDSLSVEDIKSSMAEIFPEIKSASAIVEGATIKFEVKAGTKGMRTVTYGANTLNIEDDSLSVEDIKASMAEIFPEIKSAEAVVEGSSITFQVKAGTKGARTVVYGANRLSIEDDSLSIEDIKSSMAEIFPEVKSADAVLEGSEIHFKVKAGTKGMARTVVYGANRLNIEDDSLSIEDIKSSMSEIFPEIKSAEASLENGEIHFKVKAGTKGMARTVVYGANRLSIEDDSLSVSDIQSSMAEIFPEIKSAEATLEGAEIHFKVKAGTKGARTVVYGANRLSIEDDSLSIEDVKSSMAEIFPEIKSAEATLENGEIHFKVKAGTKGMARTVVYGANRLNIEDDSLSIEDIKSSMSEIFPEVKSAEAVLEGTEIHFKVKAGTKGN